MENTKNISSEQELLELLNEGKINEDEYHDLLGTLQRRPQNDSGSATPTEFKPVRTSGLAIASIVLALAGVILGYSILGLTIVILVPILLPLLAYHRAGINQPPMIKFVVLRQYPLDNIQGLITQSDVSIDRQISSDGNGSLRIETTESTTIRLFETGALDVENARLIYQAKVRTENVSGQVYLEMWCHLPGKGEYFSKGLESPVTGTTNWTTLETPFFLKKGQKPDNVKLNLVINGHGTVWIDDIRLMMNAPLN